MVEKIKGEIRKDDKLKNEIIARLEKCEMKNVKLEIMAIEVYCNYVRADEPDILTYEAISSQNFPDEKIKECLVQLERRLEGETNGESLESDNNCHEKFRQFVKEQEKELICEEKTLDYNGRKFLGLLIRLEGDLLNYKCIMEYMAGEILSDLETIEAVYGFIAFNSAFPKMANRRMLFENYVDHYLNENKLPTAKVLIELSAEKYEGSESEARIYIACPNIDTLGMLDEMGKDSRIIKSENRRMIRKMMEISKQGKVYLYAEKEDEGEYYQITRLIKKNEKDKNGDEELYIRFFGYLCWSIVCNGKEEIIYERGQYILNPSENKEEYLTEIDTLKDKISQTMPDELTEWFESNKLKDLMEILKEQKHGTAVILTNDAEEAKRLCSYNYGIYVNKDMGMCRRNGMWDEEQILSLTSIDGALFLNLEGECVALGVIVDGKVTVKGNTGRGSRYNSIVNYVRRKEKEQIYLGIIISEDGMVKLTCNLEPEEDSD